VTGSPRLLVVTLGDALLDVVVRLSAPLPPDGEAPATSVAGAGGQAANVAAWAAELGADARLVCKRAEDVAGRLVSDDLERRGVDLVGPVVEGRTGIVVSLVAPDGTRSLASDRGVAPELRAEELEMAWLRGCDVLHLSGYALLRGPVDQAGAKAGGAVRQQNGRISVDLSSAEAIGAFGAERFRRRLEQLGPDVVFGNEDEWDAVADDLTFVPQRVVKLGARGFSLDGPEGSRTFPSSPGQAVDSTGAGDALAAGFLVGGPELAVEAAARCVSKLGALP
jgi:sugar/nucleoside kinase (ribokinase family)